MYYYSSCIDGHMELLTDDRHESYLKCGPSDVKIEVISHYFTHYLWPQFLIVLDGVSYTNMQGCMQGVAKAPVIWGVL